MVDKTKELNVDMIKEMSANDWKSALEDGLFQGDVLCRAAMQKWYEFEAQSASGIELEYIDKAKKDLLLQHHDARIMRDFSFLKCGYEGQLQNRSDEMAYESQYDGWKQLCEGLEKAIQLERVEE